MEFHRSICSRGQLVPALLLVAITCVVFGQVARFEFVNVDDSQYVTENPYVDTLGVRNFVWAWTTNAAGNWHPLTWLSLILDATLFGKRAGAFHVTNLALHLANVLLLFGALRTLTGATARSACVAALFAIHPLHVESVAWVSERKDVLSTLFGFASLWSYALYARNDRKRWYALSLACLVLSLLAKQMLVTWPFVFLLLDFWPLRRDTSDGQPSPGNIWRRLVAEKIPFLLVACVFCVAAFVAQHQGGSVHDLHAFPVKVRVENALIAYELYLAKTFWPRHLAVFYPHPGSTLPLGQVMGAAAVLAAISVVAFSQRRRYPCLLVGWLWFLGTLVPVIGLVQIGDQQMADRYSYVPLIGIFLALVWFLPECAPAGWWRTHFVPAAWFAVVALCAGLSWRQTAVWSNSLTLFQHAIAVTRSNSFAENNLGNALEIAGRHDEARLHFHRAAALDPKPYLALTNLGGLALFEGKPAEAAGYFRRALSFQPRHVEGLRRLGQALIQMGEVEAAREKFEAALRIAPDDPLTHGELGELLRREGRLDQALVHFTAAAEVESTSAAAQTNLGVALADHRRFDEAAECFLKALELDRGFLPARLNLAALRHSQGRFYESLRQFEEAWKLDSRNEAVRHGLAAECVNVGSQSDDEYSLPAAIAQFRRALELVPDHFDAHYRLARALARQRDFDGSVTHFRRAIELRPDFSEAHADFGVLLIQGGRKREAIRELETALELNPDLTAVRQILERARAGDSQ